MCNKIDIDYPPPKELVQLPRLARLRPPALSPPWHLWLPATPAAPPAPPCTRMSAVRCIGVKWGKYGHGMTPSVWLQVQDEECTTVNDEICEVSQQEQCETVQDRRCSVSYSKSCSPNK